MTKTRKRKLETEDRYLHKLPKGAPEKMNVWSTIQKHSMESTGSRCSMNIFHKATAVHHVRYGVRRWTTLKPIRGYERPGKDVFPLCSKCHAKAHKNENWINQHGKDYAFVFGSRNTKAYQGWIRISWIINSRIVKVPGVFQFLKVWDCIGLGVLILPTLVAVSALSLVNNFTKEREPIVSCPAPDIVMTMQGLEPCRKPLESIIILED